MSAFGWNMRRGNNMRNNQLSQSRLALQIRPALPCSSNQIACRICNQVFASTLDLINHIESHMTQEDTLAMARSWQQNPSLFSSHTDLFSNPCNIPPFSPLQFDNLYRHLPHVPQLMQYNSYPSLMPQEPNPVPISSFNSTTPVSSTVPASLQLSPYNRNNRPLSRSPPQLLTAAPYASCRGRQHRPVMQDPPSDDYTRPFLRQLENRRVIQCDRGRSNSDAVLVDLTLKL